MGSGLLYGGIGVLWLVVLSQRWLHRRTLVRAERSAPASSRQRIIEPRSDRRTRSATVLAMTPANGSGAALGSGEVFEGIAAAGRRSRAVHRRRRILLSLLVITAAATVSAVLAGIPSWVPVAAAGATLCWFASGVSVARAGRRARRGHRRRVRHRELARGADVSAAGPALGLPTGPVRQVRSAAAAAWDATSRGDSESTWDSVPSVDVVARWGREDSDTDGLDRRQLTAVVAPDPMPEPDPASWQPIPVPLPSYLTAPRVPRTVARIDFGITGSWTSALSTATTTKTSTVAADGAGAGRGPVQLGRSTTPRSRVEVEASGERQKTYGNAAGLEGEPTAEVPYELPRAVGD